MNTDIGQTKLPSVVGSLHAASLSGQYCRDERYACAAVPRQSLRNQALNLHSTITTRADPKKYTVVRCVSFYRNNEMVPRTLIFTQVWCSASHTQSLKASSWTLAIGCQMYSRTVRLPDSTSTVAVMPGMNVTATPVSSKINSPSIATSTR